MQSPTMTVPPRVCMRDCKCDHAPAVDLCIFAYVVVCTEAHALTEIVWDDAGWVCVRAFACVLGIRLNKALLLRSYDSNHRILW